MWIALAILEVPPEIANAIHTLYAILLRTRTRSVHYMRNIGATFQSTTYSVRIEANIPQVLYIVYGFEVSFWRGRSGFVDRSSVLEVQVWRLLEKKIFCSKTFEKNVSVMEFREVMEQSF